MRQKCGVVDRVVHTQLCVPHTCRGEDRVTAQRGVGPMGYRGGARGRQGGGEVCGQRKA